VFHQSHTDAAPVTVAVATAPRQDPRRRLLDAMLETVALRGYDRTTVSRVLSSSGIQEAVFSEHFHDKRNCFLVAIDELLGNVECAAVELFREPAAWPERVRFGLRSLLDALAEHPDEARVAFVEMLGAGPAACERGRAVLALFAALMEEGRYYTPNPDQLPAQTSEAIVGGIVSIVHRRVLQGNVEELPSLHSDLTYFALLPYLDHERALAAATSL
jgi:AcrR family transcriptional regulator